MKFTVVFIAQTSPGRTPLFFDTPEIEIGIKGVDSIRNKFPDITLDKIAPLIHNFKENPVLSLTYDEALETGGLFTECNEVTVRSDHNRNYLLKETIVDDSERVHIEHKYDPEDVLNAWKEAGYPLEWKSKVSSEPA